MKEHGPVTFRVSLLAGGVAGTSVDVALFPLDTIKTRLQTPQGFLQAGGFKGIYRGIASAAAGSAPSAATFFCTYELIKNTFSSQFPQRYTPVLHMLAASLGELTALVVRNPFEVIKQRAQAYHNCTSKEALRITLTQEGFRGLYRGYMNCVYREVPFSLIQFPLWEFAKSRWSEFQGYRVDAWQSSICGGCAGGFSAALTTPLDVAKTRVMLEQKGSVKTHLNVVGMLRGIYAKEGIKSLFAGVTPRVAWICLGGAVFFGVYEKTKLILIGCGKL